MHSLRDFFFQYGPVFDTWQLSDSHLYFILYTLRFCRGTNFGTAIERNTKWLKLEKIRWERKIWANGHRNKADSTVTVSGSLMTFNRTQKISDTMLFAKYAKKWLKRRQLNASWSTGFFLIFSLKRMYSKFTRMPFFLIKQEKVQ